MLDTAETEESSTIMNHQRSPRWGRGRRPTGGARLKELTLINMPKA